MMDFRWLMATLDLRSKLAAIAGKTFGGKRDMYKALGYKRVLTVADYRARYERNAIANRVVNALPKATWKGGAEIVEDDDPTVETKFEAAWADLAERLKIWSIFQRADRLAGIGHYSIILIGAPGALDSPLMEAGPDDIKYLQPFAEDDAAIQEYDADIRSPRFGLPRYYTVKRTNLANASGAQAINSTGEAKRVHYSRVLHVADGLMDDNIYGEPRLRCIWNLLDDLEKVTGGGAEAFWRRADQGIQFDLDPTLDLDEPAKERLKEQIKEYEHGFRRFLTTRGVKIDSIGSDVADFAKPVEAIISQIAAGTEIPQRILIGSEQAKLASSVDRSNWDERVDNRRIDYASVYIIRPFIDRMIELGALPTPELGAYDIKWTSLRVLDDAQRAEVASKWAELNTKAAETVVLPDEIRTKILGLPELEAVQSPEEAQARAREKARQQQGLDTEPTAASAKGEAEWAHVLRSADRFRRTRLSRRERILRYRQARGQAGEARSGARSEGRESGTHGDGRRDSRLREEAPAAAEAIS
jgi:hypothetical protein